MLSTFFFFYFFLFRLSIREPIERATHVSSYIYKHGAGSALDMYKRILALDEWTTWQIDNRTPNWLETRTCMLNYYDDDEGVCAHNVEYQNN